MRPLAVLLVAGLPAAFAGRAAADPPPLPGLGPAAVRIAVDRDRAPWRAIGRVQTELGERCTGFLLAPAVVATAGHCLFLPKVGRFIPPHDVHFLRGVALDTWRAHARARSAAVPPGYDPHREWQTLRLDRAFLTLDAPAGGPGDVLAIADRMPPPGTPLALAGYGQDREQRLLADLHCHLLGVADGVIRHDCAATRGASGAPLLAETAPGTWRAIGIEVAADAPGIGGLAVSIVPVAPSRGP